MQKITKIFRGELQKWIDIETVFFYQKGRVTFYALLVPDGGCNPRRFIPSDRFFQAKTLRCRLQTCSSRKYVIAYGEKILAFYFNIRWQRHQN
ncbi:hypothetical protein THIOM_002178 [Candidatus Thiomargarita nelsonii]|uniref:Uncharacterized protein n=1 Tax=Candidatus Thiomargarita nelsonii TaxID=1003181 RepID=A0A0A6P2K4_9GAMM|nr:hypothetical protein THIOM_002178 [Candidatus Thiomargarita nelsonii]